MGPMARNVYLTPRKLKTGSTAKILLQSTKENVEHLTSEAARLAKGMNPTMRMCDLVDVCACLLAHNAERLQALQPKRNDSISNGGKSDSTFTSNGTYSAAASKGVRTSEGELEDDIALLLEAIDTAHSARARPQPAAAPARPAVARVLSASPESRLPLPPPPTAVLAPAPRAASAVAAPTRLRQPQASATPRAPPRAPTALAALETPPTPTLDDVGLSATALAAMRPGDASPPVTRAARAHEGDGDYDSDASLPPTPVTPALTPRTARLPGMTNSAARAAESNTETFARRAPAAVAGPTPVAGPALIAAVTAAEYATTPDYARLQIDYESLCGVVARANALFAGLAPEARAAGVAQAAMLGLGASAGQVRAALLMLVSLRRLACDRAGGEARYCLPAGPA